ncbi:hypothetical protein BDN72DRAFT_857900 [Pluteus cervinus]|uniref:Uncharacterized protein n=1 Tax=Pluteus cervinus TaxID=181527 RepID=A0ACD3ATU4_9AGAR|nr:hypothetical protein BDN72DRAFT_857900 [Pluteus cervinus]
MATITPETVSLRLAVPEEFPVIMESGTRAFIHDPVFNYFGQVDEFLDIDVNSKGRQGVENFIRFLLIGAKELKGRVVVAVKPQEPGAESSPLKVENIVGAAIWLPPHKRLAPWRVPLFIRAGLFRGFKLWGVGLLNRIILDHVDKSEKALDECYKSRGIKESPEKSWYLQLIWVNPDFQGQGYLSVLMQEGFKNNGGDVPFTLEATTARSRDRYLHFGFELITPFRIGVKSTNELGLTTRGGPGVEVYSMIHWNDSQKEKPVATS